MMPSYPTTLVAYPSEEEAVKRVVMTYYGHTCVCPGCGEETLHLLHLDHIAAGGNADRRRLKRRGTSFYREVKAAIDRDAPTDRAWLAGFQILCQRCNMSKGDGPSCRIDHSQDSMNDSSHFGEEVDEPDHTARPLGNAQASDEELERFSTRMKPGTKARLLQLASTRGVAAGVVIDDLLRERETQPWIVIEQKLDSVLEQLSRMSQPPSAGVPVSSGRHPSEDPMQLAAWQAFKQAWDQQHPDPAFPVMAQPIIDRKRGRWAKWFGG